MFDVTDATGVTAAGLNDVFRGDVYGERPIFSPETFATHVQTNDIDVRRSICLRDEEGGVAALALIGIREHRAWIGGFGVSPKYRRMGLGTKCLDGALRSVRRAGCGSIELEVLETNRGAIALYASHGFRDAGKLFVWQSSGGGLVNAPFPYTAFPEDAVRAGTMRIPACWQREDVSLRRQPGPFAIEQYATSWAILRQHAEVTRIVDVVAADDDVRHLFDRLTGYQPLLLVNEPAISNVSAELARRGWPPPRVQYRMIRSLE